MADEITVPLLPCRSIDEMLEFYEMLGFTKTYYQRRPYTYVAVRREDINLHFFGLPDYKPEDSYSTCLVVVPDPGELFDAFAAGMRAAHGKVLVSGIPRMTRPRKRKNADNLPGFSVVDPGGNWIRIIAAKADPADDEPARNRLAVAVRGAVVMGDSKGDEESAAKMLDNALDREQDAPPADLVEALAYRAELAVRLGDPGGAREFLAKANAVTLSDAERAKLGGTLGDLATTLEPALGS
ncbi:hypothetical protein SAMN05421504_1011227 [Amycolatopsis xylanica]|uniref:VOC family protein n=1 Tax=Amycolatopsis xylanica TaxID=589385 RepID=A0A1H2VIL3_9PSEU|nr:hypothetical protein [Amycolatopsis xylanica]SDW67739.1 hypothetical protein SAMN05421504_1011227 [Amycolatopsis xylanica]